MPSQPLTASDPSILRPETRPIRVLLWSVKGAGLHYGGPGTSAYRFYAKARPGQFEVSLAHGFEDQERYPLFADQFFVGSAGIRSWEQFRFVRQGVAWIRRHWREFDVMHTTCGFEGSVTPAHAADRLGLPSIVQIACHQSDIGIRNKSWVRQWLGVVRRRQRRLAEISAVIATSSWIERELLDCGVPPHKIARIPYAVDTDQFCPPADEENRRSLRAKLGWRDLPTVIFSGAVIPRKRPLELVEAIGLLRKKGIECQAVLLGPLTDAPEYVANIRQRIAELGLEELVRLPGFTTEVARAYQASDIFCLPSKNEGLPNAMLEAMSCGLPSVVTPISGCVDVVDDGRNSRIVDGRPESIAEAVEGYLTNPTLRQASSEAIRALILERYSYGVVLNLHETLYRRVMAEKRG